MEFFRVGKVHRGVVTLYSDSVMGPTKRERERDEKEVSVRANFRACGDLTADEPVSLVLKGLHYTKSTLLPLTYSSQNLCDGNQGATVLWMRVFRREFFHFFLCYQLTCWCEIMQLNRLAANRNASRQIYA